MPFVNKKSGFILVVTVVIIGSLVSVWWYTSHRHPGDLFQAPAGIDLPLHTDTEWIDAKDKFGAGEYADAINSLESHLAGYPEHTDAWFLLGLCCLETGQEERAIQIMDEVRINDPFYYPDATWYMGLACLKNDDMDRARLLMAELANGPDSLFQAKANLVIQRFL